MRILLFIKKLLWTVWWGSLHFIFCFSRVLRRTAHAFLSFELSGSTVPWRKVSILPLLSLSEILATPFYPLSFLSLYLSHKRARSSPVIRSPVIRACFSPINRERSSPVIQSPVIRECFSPIIHVSEIFKKYQVSGTRDFFLFFFAFLLCNKHLLPTSLSTLSYLFLLFLICFYSFPSVSISSICFYSLSTKEQINQTC